MFKISQHHTREPVNFLSKKSPARRVGDEGEREEGRRKARIQIAGIEKKENVILQNCNDDNEMEIN